MTSTKFALVFALALGLTTVACTDNDEVDDPDQQLLLDGKADGYSDLSGPWVRYDATGGDLRELVLASDRTYTATYWRECVVAGCETEDGTFKLTKSTTSSTKYIRLTHDGELVARYAYTYGSGHLRLRDTDNGARITLERPVCWGDSALACSNDPVCEYVPGHPCDPIPGGPACPPSGPHCEARACEELDFATCAENPACVQVPGQPCDPPPGGPECPPDIGPHCETR